MAEARANASAVEPATKHLPLAELSKSSVKTKGTWDVIVCHPFEDTYEYTFQGKPRHGTNFVCTLVCVQESRVYCEA